MIYLDNAATTYPKPISVNNAMIKSLKKYGANPGRSGHKMSMEAALEIYNCRKTISDFFNAKGPECVIFTLNCTHALNIVIKGILKEGDHVVISNLEHNSVIRPIYSLSQKGISYTIAKVFPEDNDATLNSFREALQENTKLVVCMHASNVWGFRLPVERLAALSHQYDIPILVDAAQSAGVLSIDIKDSNIDFLCVSGHKGLYGPMGTGILIANNYEQLDTIIEGGTGTNSISYDQPIVMPERFESGTPNMSGIAGLKAGIEFVNHTGRENILNHEFDLISKLYNKMLNISKIELYTSEPSSLYFVPLLSFNIKGFESEAVGELLDNNGILVRAGLQCSPLAHRFFDTVDRGAVRICPSVFTKESEINTLIKVLRNIH